jgi:hypothetical protein
MDLSVTLAAMLDAGCTREQMLAVVQAHENEKKKGDAVRRAKDAERQRRHRLSRSVTRDRRDTALLSPPVLSPPPPPLSLTSPPTSKRKGPASPKAGFPTKGRSSGREPLSRLPLTMFGVRPKPSRITGRPPLARRP